MLYLIFYVSCLYVFIHRPETVEGQQSPSPLVNPNGENWENESTSSAASNTEYTGREWNTNKG